MNNKFLDQLIAIRRKIHRYPELGEREFRTAQFIEKNLRALKIKFRRVGKTGVLASLGQGARCIALRADMDALPLMEKKPLPYASKNRGVMHACGHDAHVAMLLGAAMLLAQKKNLPGVVKFFFQPNEEGSGGAKSLVSAGVMQNPKVQAVVGLHVNPRFPTGKIGLKPGPLMASVDKFTLEIFGQGGHAAYPHEGKDAILIAAEAILALQSIVSRRIDPLEPAVLTIGTMQGGARYNILAEKVTLTGTVRTLSSKTQAQIPRFMRQILQGVTKSHGGKYKLDYQTIGALLANDPKVCALSRQVAARVFGESQIVDLETASMGGEDFSEYLRQAPGCFIYIGTGNKALGTQFPWHHPEFNIDERALIVGSTLLSEVAQEFLTKGTA